MGGGQQIEYFRLVVSERVCFSFEFTVLCQYSNSRPLFNFQKVKFPRRKFYGSPVAFGLSILMCPFLIEDIVSIPRLLHLFVLTYFTYIQNKVYFARMQNEAISTKHANLFFLNFLIFSKSF